ncbi:NAD-dependent epimerase/dehydratase family protein [Flavobacterium hercynium]|uniref:UDP-galactose-4-epimerase n=1 Tax=Flavobacterium hercynium TaxID=387094 RepID=A0A226HDD9_9FLAO|nr:NAD-dependent epimerase/dehydratase family protein [Flavobacterium hercynium]OXA92195.1 UDP-galactose-4-epimerase [Flavobacterium hercynium]SMP24524.1 Nucleoside-diphosphate-sugar epimerase [Flavobacterium hercynium]
MNILLVGSNGFLGNIIKMELDKDNDFTTLSRSGCNYNVSLENEVPNFIKSFDLVIHSAGKAHSVPKTEEDKKQFHDVNVTGTLNLLKGLEKSGLPKSFVFISSVSVYGREIGTSIDEDHPLQAKDPYGVSKIEAEKHVEEWCRSNNVVFTILRLPLLVGKDAPGNLGAMVKAINKGYYFNIGGGIAKKSMVLAKDVAVFISQVAPIGGVYNLTDGVHPNFKDLSFAISKSNKQQINLPFFVAKMFGKIGDILGDKAPINSKKVQKITSDLTFDDSKARKLLNWKPESVLSYLKNEKI